MCKQDEKSEMKKYVSLLIGQAGFSGQINEVAAAIGASTKSVYKWLGGVSVPSVTYLLALQRLARVPGVL